MGDRDKASERDRDRGRDRDRSGDRDRDRERERERERDKDRNKERDIDRDRERGDRDRGRDRVRDSDTNREARRDNRDNKEDDRDKRGDDKLKENIEVGRESAGREKRDEREAARPNKDDSEEKKRKKRGRSSSSSSSSSSDSSSDEEKKRKRKKKEKKEKKEKRKHKKDKHNKEKKKHKKIKDVLVEQAKQFIKENKIESAKISKEDYFNKAVEFRTWMREENNIFIDEFPSDEAKEIFSMFVDRWNTGQLPDKYYKGLTIASNDSSSRTNYKWGFASKIDPIVLGTLRDEVDTDTNKKFAAAFNKPDIPSRQPPAVSHLGPKQGPAKPGAEEEELDEEDRRRLARTAYKKDLKGYQKRKDEVLDELLPKATGRDAMIEKKKMKNEFNKRKDDSPEMREEDLMGSGGGSDFKSVLQYERNRTMNRQMKQQEERQRKMDDYQAKEDAKLAPFRLLAAMRFQNGGGLAPPPS